MPKDLMDMISPSLRSHSTQKKFETQRALKELLDLMKFLICG